MKNRFYSVSYDWTYTEKRRFSQIIFGTREQAEKWFIDHMNTIKEDWLKEQVIEEYKNNRVDIKECKMPYINLSNKP